MSRAPFQVLIFPYIIDSECIEFAIFKREDSSTWQAVAGGGEEGETFLEAAKRETWEESGISQDSKYITLDSVATIPVENVVGKFLWGEDVFVIPEYTFGVEVKDKKLTLSREHLEYKWVKYQEAKNLLKWDSNRNALWELNKRLEREK